MKLIKSTSAKAMQELSKSFIVGDSLVRRVFKEIELTATLGSYFIRYYRLHYEEAAQLQKILKKDGYKVNFELDDCSEDSHYILTIDWSK